MKSLLLLLTLGACLMGSALAQSTSPGSAGPASSHPAPPPQNGDGPPPNGGHMGGLTPDERHQLMAARKAAFEANPNLKAEQDALQKKIDAAMIKADPSVAPLLAKMEEGRKAHEGGGPGAPPPPQDNTAGASKAKSGGGGAH